MGKKEACHIVLALKLLTIDLNSDMNQELSAVLSQVQFLQQLPQSLDKIISMEMPLGLVPTDKRRRWSGGWHARGEAELTSFPEMHPRRISDPAI